MLGSNVKVFPDHEKVPGTFGDIENDDSTSVRFISRLKVIVRGLVVATVVPEGYADTTLGLVVVGAEPVSAK